jgi:hypothetical protein
MSKKIISLYLILLIISGIRAQQVEWELMTANAAFQPRDGAGPFVFDGQMWLVGGWNPDSVPTTNNEVWKSSDGVNWTCVNPEAPWLGRHCLGTVVYDNKMWIIGGDGNTDVWNSDDGVIWTLITDSVPWGKRYKPYVLVFHDTIWMMGGFNYYNGNAIPYNDVWYTVDGTNWFMAISDAGWAPRGIIHGKVVFDDKIWILGGGLYVMNGYPSETYYNDVWNSSDGIHWNQVLSSAPWVGRIHHSTEVFDGRMWLMAGHNKNIPAGPYHLRNDVWYSYDGVNWTELPNTPWDYTHAASIYIYDSALWLAAGYLRNEVWRLHKSPDIGIEVITKNNFIIYPNPAMDLINVKFVNDTKSEEVWNLLIYNYQGKIVKKNVIKTTKYQHNSINISDLANGIYYIILSNEISQQVVKLVVQR